MQVSPVANPAVLQNPFASGESRAIAFVLDLVAIAILRAAASEVAPPLAAGGVAATTAGWLIAFAYFTAMPLTPMQGTPGKWICRIKLCDRAGRRLSIGRSAVRAGAMLAWLSMAIAFPVALALLPLAWAPIWVRARRESLFDSLAGSLVVRISATAEVVAAYDVTGKPSVVKVVGVVILFLAMGTVISVFEGVNRDRDRRTRVSYALTQVVPLRERISTFHAREKRWPTPEELGVAKWTPYPDGGGYSPQADGSILVTFTVLPELKGRSVRLRPVLGEDVSKLTWVCAADQELNRSFLPATCR